MSKYFIITMDTEGDNQWDLEHVCSTKNARYIDRFQKLSEKYGYKPVWLTNYEMAMDPYYVEYMKECLKYKKCEIGMHLHAWNSPPEFKLQKVNNCREYLIEYPENIMEEKIKVLTELLSEQFEGEIVSHRSGRWALNEKYLKILSRYGYLVDCSVTPHINWKNCSGATGIPGSDYSACSEAPYYIYDDLMEIPVSIRNIRCFQMDRIHSVKGIARECKRYVKGYSQWIRPDKELSVKGIKRVAKLISQEPTDYLMFMMHSSELMPGGSPSFPNEHSIDRLYEKIEEIYNYIKELGYIGITLKEYYELKKNNIG